MRRLVVDLHSPRPLWCVPAATVRVIREALGPDWIVKNLRTPAPSDGDGGAGSVEAVRVARGAEVYIGWGIPAGVARAGAGTLRWAHSAAAGVGSSLTPELKATGAVFTNSRVIQAEPMADWVVAAIGFCLRGFHAAVSAQHARRWAKDVFTDNTTVRAREFGGTRIGVVGLGGVGRAVARRCVALGMEVRAVRRRPERRSPAGVRWVGGAHEITKLARQSDVLVIGAAHTRQTTRLVDGRVLRALPRGAFVVNVARGALLDEDALVSFLDSGHLAGCVLDVVSVEPLPKEHVFWRHPSVLMFPHVSAVSERFWTRETELILENVNRYLYGRRLKNVVDFEAGY